MNDSLKIRCQSYAISIDLLALHHVTNLEANLHKSADPNKTGYSGSSIAFVHRPCDVFWKGTPQYFFVSLLLCIFSSFF